MGNIIIPHDISVPVTEVNLISESKQVKKLLIAILCIYAILSVGKSTFLHVFIQIFASEINVAQLF